MQRKPHLHLHNAAVALAGVAQALVIEQASVVADGVPTRRPSPRVQLVPFGEFASRDGRPYGMQVDVVGADGRVTQKTVTVRCWTINNQQGFDLMTRLNNRHANGKASFGFDYEHQSLTAQTSGQPAPRSGSGAKFEWVWDDGLYITDVVWTAKAAEMILAEEYKYVSPVLFFNPDTGEVLDVFNAALVHTPALQELAGLQVSFADLAARLSLASASAAHQPLEDTPVNLLEQLIAKGVLPAGTTEANALAALASQHTKLSAACSALKLDPATADASAITAALGAATTGQAVAAALGAALSLPADAVADPAKATAVAVSLAAKAATAGGADASAQAIAALSAQVAQINADNTTRQLNELVDGAKHDGKLTPAMEAWARGLGVAGLSAYLQNAPVIAPTQSASQGSGAHNPAAAAAVLSADAKSIAAQLGLAESDLV